MGPKVKHRGRNWPERATIANIRFARGVFTIWLNPVTASNMLIQIEPAASQITLAAVRTW
jgi:hypothetical protein